MAHIIIDGYNLIRSSLLLNLSGPLSLEQERMTLIQKLSHYRKLKGHQITVVFDASRTENVGVTEDRIEGIKVLYSEMRQTADAIMIDLARRLKDQVMIVTSDNEILHAARSSGCSYLSSQEFEKKLGEALTYSEKDLERDQPEISQIHKRFLTKKKGPSKRLPKAKRRALNKLKEI